MRKQHWRQGRLYVLENVLAEVCRECGEHYFHATTLAEIEQKLGHDHDVKEILQVEVVAV